MTSIRTDPAPDRVRGGARRQVLPELVQVTERGRLDGHRPASRPSTALGAPASYLPGDRAAFERYARRRAGGGVYRQPVSAVRRAGGGAGLPLSRLGPPGDRAGATRRSWSGAAPR